MEMKIECKENAIKSTKERLGDQLDKRNRERQQQASAKIELHKKNHAENENPDLFQETFRAQAKAIENDLSNLTEGLERDKLIKIFQEIVERVSNLQNYLTSSKFFLPTYSIKMYQTAIHDLECRIEATKEKLLVKKKFNFRSKVTPKEISTVDCGAMATKTSSNAFDNFNWTVENRENQVITLTANETNTKDLTISTLKECIIEIFGYPSSLQLSHLSDCIVLCGPVARSIFASNCNNCKLVFGCQQLRLHSSNTCDLYLHVTSRAIIEDSQNIQVAPYNYNYANIDDDFTAAGLDLTKNNWCNLADFNWLSNDKESPNWHQMPSEQRITNWPQHLNEFQQLHFSHLIK